MELVVLAIETAVCKQEALERTMWEILLITQLNPIPLVTCFDAPALGCSCFSDMWNLKHHNM